VWAWGWNGYGQLGLGGDGKTPSPVVGPGGSGLLTGATGVAAGYYFSVALKSDNTVWGWGSNDAGQLGNGTLASSDTPRQVVGPGGSGVLTDVAAISGGYSHTAALRTDGTVWAWGLNIYGQLGDGSTGYSRTPVQVVGPEGNGVMTGVSAIAAGFWHTVALRPDGTVWTWGSNSNGQLGNGAAANSATPVQVLGPGGSGVLTDVVAISAGGFHTVALKSDGTVWAWGVNTEAELGNASAMYSSATPLQVAGPDGVGNLTGVAAISAGSRYTVALKTDGTVCAWGTGPSGSGVYSRMTAPVQIPGPGGAGVLTEVVAVSAGFDQVVAIRADNSVWTWGSNYGGQLGDGTTTDHLAPIQVAGLDGSGILTGAIAGAAGYLHTLALKSDGTVWLWGTNLYGQLGHPDGYSAPVQSLSASGAPFVVSDSGRILSAAMARDFGGPVQGGSDKSGGGCAIAKHPGDGSGTAVCLLAVLLGLRFGRRFRARRERRASGVGVSP
jgi:alpha-tubulin suppressor-like RCC1 family protein